MVSTSNDDDDSSLCLMPVWVSTICIRLFVQVTQNHQAVYLLCANNIATAWLFLFFFLFSQDLHATTGTSNLVLRWTGSVRMHLSLWGTQWGQPIPWGWLAALGGQPLGFCPVGFLVGLCSRCMFLGCIRGFVDFLHICRQHFPQERTVCRIHLCMCVQCSIVLSGWTPHVGLWALWSVLWDWGMVGLCWRWWIIISWALSASHRSMLCGWWTWLNREQILWMSLLCTPG